MKNTPVKMLSQSRLAERGSTVVALVMVVFVVLLIATVALKSSFLRLKGLGSVKTRYSESIKAESGVNILEAVLKKRLSENFTADSQLAKNCQAQPGNLPFFDDANITVSNPRYRNGECLRNGVSTSLLGNLNEYLAAKTPGLEQEAQTLVAEPEIKSKIAALTESARIFSSSGEPSYLVEYILDASGGSYGRARRQGRTMFAVNTANCGVYAVMQAANSSVTLGQPATLRISYSYATVLKIYNAANILIHEQNVSENSAAQVFDYNFSPTVTDSYRVEALGAGTSGCRSVSSPVQITVTNPAELCPVINSFSSSSSNVFDGETVAVSWNISNGANYRLDGAAVGASGSQNFVINGSRTFTLTADNASNTCPAARQITVTSQPRPPCAPTPVIDSFAANPAAIQTYGATRLSWNVSNIVAGGAVRIAGSDGSSYNVGASGNLDISGSAAGTVTYTIYATNSCNGTDYTAQRQVTVTIANCPPPVIDSFTVNPQTVTIGANQVIQFAWNASSQCAANVSIDNGVGSSLPVSGNISVGQPNSTMTYTLTISNSSGTAQRQVTVNALAPPSKPPGICTPAVTSPESYELAIFGETQENRGGGRGGGQTETYSGGAYTSGSYQNGNLTFEMNAIADFSRGRRGVTYWVEPVKFISSSFIFAGLNFEIRRTVFPSYFEGRTSQEADQNAYSDDAMINDTQVRILLNGALLRNYPVQRCLGGETGVACASLSGIRIRDTISTGVSNQFSGSNSGGVIYTSNNTGSESRIQLNRQTITSTCN